MTEYIIIDYSRQITIKQEQETGEHKYTVYSESILVSISESLSGQRIHKLLPGKTSALGKYCSCICENTLSELKSVVSQ